MPVQGKNHGRGRYHVYSPDHKRITTLGNAPDRAAAEQLAQSRSRTTPGVWRVEQEADSQAAAKFENGKRIR